MMYFPVLAIFCVLCTADYIVLSNVHGVDRYYKADSCLREDMINEYWRRYEVYNETHYSLSSYVTEFRCKARLPDSVIYGKLDLRSSVEIDKYAFCTVYYYDRQCTEYIPLPVTCYEEETCISDPEGGSVYFRKDPDGSVRNTRYSDKECKTMFDDAVVIQEGCEYVMSPVNGYIQYNISNGTAPMLILHVSLILLILLFMNY